MRTLKLFALFSLLSPLAVAQSFNIDVGDNLVIFPVPSSAYVGAANQSGVWNASITPYNTSLMDLTGTPTSVTTSSTQSSSYNYFPSTLTGEDRNLMIDIQSLPSIGGPWSWNFNGLANGNYEVYTYAWAPENNGSITRVRGVGSSDPLQIVGGTWFGGTHVAGVTYALHHFVVTGGAITIEVEGQGGPGSVNAFQIKFTAGASLSTPFCFGDGTGAACPCTNVGSAGHGCASSLMAAGGRLSTTGNASISADTLVLHGTSLPNGPGLFFQGTTQLNGGSGAVFGDGLLCVGGSIIRLGVVFASGNAAAYPGGSTPGPISVVGFNSASDVRTYQEWYRDGDPVFCTVSTFNLTNGVELTWAP